MGELLAHGLTGSDCDELHQCKQAGKPAAQHTSSQSLGSFGRIGTQATIACNGTDRHILEQSQWP